MRRIAAGLLLGNQAGVKGAQSRVHDVVGDVSSQFHSTATLTREVLLESLAAVHEPEVALAALLLHAPAQCTAEKSHILLRWQIMNKEVPGGPYSFI